MTFYVFTDFISKLSLSLFDFRAKLRYTAVFAVGISRCADFSAEHYKSVAKVALQMVRHYFSERSFDRRLIFRRSKSEPV